MILCWNEIRSVEICYQISLPSTWPKSAVGQLTFLGAFFLGVCQSYFIDISKRTSCWKLYFCYRSDIHDNLSARFSVRMRNCHRSDCTILKIYRNSSKKSWLNWWDYKYGESGLNYFVTCKNVNWQLQIKTYMYSKFKLKKQDNLLQCYLDRYNVYI